MKSLILLLVILCCGFSWIHKKKPMSQYPPDFVYTVTIGRGDYYEVMHWTEPDGTGGGGVTFMTYRGFGH